MGYPMKVTNMSVIEKQSIKSKGGARIGAGRKKGGPNRKTLETQAFAQESGITPLEYLLTVMRDAGGEPRERINAAIAAAPYVHAKLSTVDVKSEHSGKVVFEWMTG